MDKIIGIGNALVDVLLQLPNDELLKEYNLPKGSMQLVDKHFVTEFNKRSANLNLTMASGGSASNTIHGLANLGIETGYIGKIGEDEFGNIFRSDLLKKRINPFLLKGNADSGRAITFISPDSERTFATYLGAAIEMTPEEIKPEYFKDYQLLHVEGYLVQDNNLIRTAIQLAKKLGLKVSIDLASYNVVEANLNFLKEIIEKYVDIVFANEEEAKAFTGKEPEEAIIQISKLCDIAIVKIGEKGSLLKNKNDEAKIGINKSDLIDTTGAGDLYAAGFLYGLINNMPLSKCGEIGALLASKVIEVIGPKISEAGWSYIKNKLNLTI